MAVRSRGFLSKLMAQRKCQSEISGSDSATDVEQQRISALLVQAHQGASQTRVECQKQLLTLMSDRIYRFCLSHLMRPEDAIEASQETAYRLLNKWDAFNGQSRWQTWVFGIALNVCREMHRKRDRMVVDTEMVQENVKGEIEELAQKDAVDDLKLALNGLTDRQREVVSLRFLEEMSVAETADLLEISEGTVKATLSQALTRLKERLKQDSA